MMKKVKKMTKILKKLEKNDKRRFKMNKIEKQKGGLLGLGIASLIGSVIVIALGVVLIIGGALNLAENVPTAGIIMLVFGGICCILFFATLIFGIYAVWVSVSLKATQGSIKEGNIAKEGGTVNMRKCDKCGTELKDGETVCSNCGKEFN